MAELHSAIFKPLFCALKLNGIKTSVMTDYHKFVHALEVISVPLKSGQININQTIPAKGKN